MIRHMVIWALTPPEDPAARRAQIAAVKERLEAMVGKAPGLLALTVYTRPLASSSAEMALVADFTDEAALAAYQAWPPHLEVATQLVRPMVATRLCVDTVLD